MKKFVAQIVVGFALMVFLPGVTLAENDGDSTSPSHTTQPLIIAKVSGTLGSNGWYTGNVGVTWLVSDARSAIKSSSGCKAVSITSDTAGTTLTCKAKSAGGTSSKSVTIKRDATLPAETIRTPAVGASYKLGQPIMANYSCSDVMSGVASCVGTVANGVGIDTRTAGNKSFTVTATDKAGNKATRTVSYSVVGGSNTLAPVITPVISGTLGSNGWYTSNVTLAWTVTGATTQTGCTTLTVSADTAGTSYTCSATNRGGTRSQSVSIKRDATLPMATVSAPANGVSYTQGQAVMANYTCGDVMSGVASCIGTVANGAAIDTSSAGSKSFTLTATDNAGNTTTKTVSYSVGAATAANSTGTQLLAWNDLGMHCADSDFSVFTLLPPFNNLNAQLVLAGTLVTPGTSGISLTYEATQDPTGSVNSFSIGKTNFWTYDQPLFGVSLRADYGLTGNPTASYTPAPMAANTTNNWFEATGIPITPVDDAYHTNYFPMVKVTARDSTGSVVATSNTVLPISSEINCNTCHASNTGSAAAMPTGGWVNNADTAQKDWRLNILRLHDEKNAAYVNGSVTYASLLSGKNFGSSLESSANSGRPILCDTCHNSNALAQWGIVGTAGISNMTAAMHSRHSGVSLPGSTATLDSVQTRDTCYNCHPGKNTQCLRGAMGNPVDSTGKHEMECQSCHGTMATVGNAARNGWMDVPQCQNCHHDGVRETSAINANGTFKTWTDIRFASTANTPVAGASLYRYSAGHGNLQCEACHNSTHAEFTDTPSVGGNSTNDNLRAINAQGYAAALRECSACHTSTPSTTNGGPHNIHPVGQTWVSQHQDAPKTDCTYCHGTDATGSPLATIKVAKTLNNKSFVAGQRVTCWSCHNGPNP